MKKLTIVVIAVLISSYSFAQDQLITDRPTQTASATVVGIGILQIETGFLLERSEINSSLSVQRIVYPTNLFRIGLFNKLELRVVNEIVSYKTFDNASRNKLNSISGTENMQLGLKYQLTKNDNKFVMGILAHAIVPTGSRGISNQKYGLISRLSIGYEISEERSLGFNLGYDNYDLRFADEGFVRDEDGSLSYTMVYGQSLNDKIGLFVEVYGEFENFEDWNNNMDAGFTYLINNNTQLDYSYSWGLNQVMNYHSIGLSVRVGQ